MQQVKDLDALACSGSNTEEGYESQIGAQPPDDPDLPPESVVVRIGSGRDPFWADTLGAAVYERDDSTKGSTNPKTLAQQQHASPFSKSRSKSHRFSGSLQQNPPIIGIHGKIQNRSGYLGRSGRRPADARIFPKKSPRPGDGEGRRQSEVPFEDPGSPKVSCIGKVLSERERDRCRRQRRQSPEEGKKVGPVSAGCWGRLSLVLSWVKRERPPRTAGANTSTGVARARATVKRTPEAEPATETPGLGAMRRFTSGRRPASWGGNGDENGGLDLGALGREAAAQPGRPIGGIVGEDGAGMVAAESAFVRFRKNV